jgi:hypothetical protein
MEEEDHGLLITIYIFWPIASKVRRPIHSESQTKYSSNISLFVNPDEQVLDLARHFRSRRRRSCHSTPPLASAEEVSLSSLLLLIVLFSGQQHRSKSWQKKSSSSSSFPFHLTWRCSQRDVCWASFGLAARSGRCSAMGWTDSTLCRRIGTT